MPASDTTGTTSACSSEATGLLGTTEAFFDNNVKPAVCTYDWYGSSFIARWGGEGGGEGVDGHARPAAH